MLVLLSTLPDRKALPTSIKVQYFHISRLVLRLYNYGAGKSGRDNAVDVAVINAHDSSGYKKSS